MHLLFLIYSLAGGGAERVTVNLANYWVAMGHRVTIATLAGRSEVSYRLDERVERIDLDVARESRKSFDALLGLVRTLRAIRRTLKRLRPDAAIGMMTTSATLLAIAALGLQLRIAGSERTHPPCYPVPRTWRVLRRVVYGWLSVVVAQTGETGEWLRRNTNARKVVVIPNPWMPVEQQRPVLKPEAVIAADANLVLAVGRLVEAKRFDLLIDAFAQLAERHSQWHLTILGEGPDRASLEALTGRLKLRGRISLPGRAGNVGEWYERADLFVLSSAYEGFPNALLEAMGSGVAAIAFACPTGPSELVKNGKNGLLVPPLDNAELARAMERLMVDPSARERLGKAAKQVRNTYQMDRIGDLWLSALVSEPAQ
jgi:glycosyltransferase involved in cell wall biosynthesis